ncbi:hypothetical protein [Halostella sp. PRR32]|uniref:hypothetical protein n=1 Tax=Halostella sp. PRR32 TaxID=3098147 RepID=UPI00110F52E4|nr:hypothetical protein [Halostella sp. PRR32]
MVTKRSLGVSLLLLGVAFAGVFHAVAALAFDSGLRYVGLGVAAAALLGIVLVNVSVTGPPRDDESGDDYSDN